MSLKFPNCKKCMKKHFGFRNIHPTIHALTVTAYSKQRDFKPKYSTVLSIQGEYKLIAIHKMHGRLCIYNEMC